MRIKDFTDTIRHLTDSFNIPEARRMIAENPALTQEQFKAGGIVEPGVTHYATEELPPGVTKHLLLRTKPYIAQAMIEGEKTKKSFATAKEAGEYYKKLMIPKGQTPLSLDEYKKLRLKHKDLTNRQFFDQILKDKYVTSRGGKYSKQLISEYNLKLNIADKVTIGKTGSGIKKGTPAFIGDKRASGLRKPPDWGSTYDYIYKRKISEAKEILNQTESGKKFVNLYNEGKIDKDELRVRAQTRLREKERTQKRVISPKEQEYRKKYRKEYYARPEFKEKQKEYNRKQRLVYEKKYGLFPIGDTPKDRFWRSLYVSASPKSDKPTRLKAVPSTIPKNKKFNTENSRKVKFYDSVTKKSFGYNELEAYMEKNIGEKSYKKALSPFEEKFLLTDTYINYKGKNVNLNKILNENLIPNYNPAQPFQQAFHVHHPFGINKNPYVTQLLAYDKNLAEFRPREQVLPEIKKATTFGEKRKVLENFVKQSDPKILTAPGKKIYGADVDLPTKIKDLYKTQGKVLPVELRTMIEKIGCPGLAAGGRVGLQEAGPVDCFKKGQLAIKTNNIKTEGQAKNMLKLAETGAKSAKLRALLGIWGLGGEAIIEAGIGAYKVLGKGVPSKIAWSESYWSYLDPRKYKGELSNLRQKDLEKGNPRIAKYFDAVDILEKRDYHEKWINQMNPDDPTHESHRNKLSQYDEIINNFYGGPSGITKMMERVQPEVANAEAEQAGKWAGEAGIEYKEPPSQVLKTPGYVSPRYKEMEEKFPTYTREQLDEMLESWGANTPWNLGFESGVKGYDQMGEWLKTHDKYKDMEAGVANRATGGIASLKKK